MGAPKGKSTLGETLDFSSEIAGRSYVIEMDGENDVRPDIIYDVSTDD